MEEFRPVENIVQKETREENDSNNRPKRNSAILSSYTESFYSFKDFTSGALSAVSPWIKWGAEKGKEGFEWSTTQGKRLIRQVSTKEGSLQDAFKEEARKMYEKIQTNLNLENFKTETLELLKKLETKNVEESKINK